MGRNLYLKTIPAEEALDIYMEQVYQSVKIKTIRIPVTKSLHCITANAVYARNSSPLFNAAAMDGVAVISSHTNGAQERNPLKLKINEDYIPVDTGDPIKPPYDSVIMAEDIVEDEEKETIQIIAAAPAWQHVRPVGEDVVAGELIIKSFQEIRPVDIGVLLSAGILEIDVIKPVSVGIIPTGTEIIEPGSEIKEDSIIESNSRMFEAQCIEAGARAKRYEPVVDDYEMIKQQLLLALQENDVVIINAGSSAGRDDYTVHILRELGEVYVHGVAMKPGKPVILAMVNNKPVIGLPGYPVSAYLDFQKFVLPVLGYCNGRKKDGSEKINAVLSKRMVSSLKHTEYVRVKVGCVEGKIVAAPLARGAGAAMSLVRADGFCVIPQEKEGYEAGDAVTVELTRKKQEIEDTIVVIGSHDLILDVIDDEMAKKKSGINVSSTHVGSMGGLMALKRHEAHMAPIHLLDEKTGEYNISYVKRMFNQPMALIKGVKRIQGIMVEKGNPLGIQSVEDLVKCRYINRQRGAGTRVLFDYLLKEKNIGIEQINGYDNEATTHMAVAAFVKSKNADAGMGIESAANAMGLDFIPVGEEEYDFAIPQQYLQLSMIKEFIEMLKDEQWQKRVMDLGGYSVENSGEIVYIEGE